MHVGAEGATADMAVVIIFRWRCILVEERHDVAGVERFMRFDLCRLVTNEGLNRLELGGRNK